MRILYFVKTFKGKSGIGKAMGDCGEELNRKLGKLTHNTM